MTLRRRRFTQSVLILDFLLSIPLVAGADRVSIVGPWLHHQNSKKYIELRTVYARNRTWVCSALDLTTNCYTGPLYYINCEILDILVGCKQVYMSRWWWLISCVAGLLHM